MTIQTFAATAAAGITNFPAVMQARLNLVGIPFTVTYDAVNHVHTFDNSTDNGNLVIGGNLLSSLGFDTALAFYNMSSPKATSCTLMSQK